MAKSATPEGGLAKAGDLGNRPGAPTAEERGRGGWGGGERATGLAAEIAGGRRVNPSSLLLICFFQFGNSGTGYLLPE